MHHDNTTAVLLVQLVLLVVVGRLLGEAMQRLRQPAVMGQLLAGVLLGPSVFGALLPAWQHWVFPADAAQKKMLDAIAQLGVLLLLLLTGMETDLDLVKRMKRMAVCASLGGMLVPFACGVALGEALPARLLPNPDARLATSLFLGIALAISSVKVVAMVIREVDYLRRNIGQVILAAAILDDTLGWIAIAAIAGLAASGGFAIGPLSVSLGGTLVFIVLCFTVGQRAVVWLIRWSNDHFTIDMPVISVILVLAFLLALATDVLGVHTALGAFMAGIMIGQSPILTGHIDEQLRGMIMGLFAPVFFGVAGLSVDLGILATPQLLLLVVLFVLIASVGKFVGCFIGGRLGGMSGAEALALATGMNARGSTEIIVATIGLSLGVLNRDLFTMIVIMALLTTLIMPPVLRRALVRIPMSDEEKARLEKEAAEEKDFLPHLERMLVVADDSADGRFAAHLGGLVAGMRRTLTTVLALAPGAGNGNGNGNGHHDRHDHEAAGGDAQAAEDPYACAISSAAAALKRGADNATQAASAVPHAASDTAQPKENGEDDGDTQAVARKFILRQVARYRDTDDDAHDQDDAPNDSVPSDERPERSVAQRTLGAIEQEAGKGYGFLIAGLEHTHGDSNNVELPSTVAALARDFDGVLGIALARPPHRDDAAAPLDIVVPVSGTDYSRRAAEVAIALAKGANARVTALHVTPRAAQRLRFWAPGKHAHAAELAVIDNLKALAMRNGVTLNVALVAHTQTDVAILSQMRQGGHNLLVLGVKPRIAEHLHFGHVAQRLLAQPQCSVLLISS